MSFFSSLFFFLRPVAEINVPVKSKEKLENQTSYLLVTTNGKTSFLVVDTKLYKRLCPFDLSVRISPLVRWSDGQMVRHAQVEKAKKRAFLILQLLLCVCVCVCVCVHVSVCICVCRSISQQYYDPHRLFFI